MRWAEGPVYFPEGGYVLVSDIPNNRIMKFDEKTGAFTVFRANANYANGNTRDRRAPRHLRALGHAPRDATETDGKLTVLADSFEGKRLNAPNDIVVKSDDSIWFTDPTLRQSTANGRARARSPSRRPRTSIASAPTAR
jgi:gluconolactonase